MTPKYAGELCDQLASGLRGSTVNLSILRDTLVAVLREQAWKERVVRNGKIVTCKSFLEMLTAPPLKGFGVDPQTIEALLCNDDEALTLFRKATVPPVGRLGRPGRKGKPTTKLKSNTDNVSIKFKHGNDRAYTLTRLKRKRLDLYQQVIAGELSAHAAAQLAGFRVKTITVISSVIGFHRAITKHLDQSAQQQLYVLLKDTLK